MYYLNLRLFSISLNSNIARNSVSLHSQLRFAAICVRKSCTRPLYLAQLKNENCSFAKISDRQFFYRLPLANKGNYHPEIIIRILSLSLSYISELILTWSGLNCRKIFDSNVLYRCCFHNLTNCASGGRVLNSQWFPGTINWFSVDQ